MDATTAQPTLLSAARNFIRKSAGTAVLAIAPLAAVSLAPEAKGQTIFANIGLNSSASSGASVNLSFPSGSRFVIQGATVGDLTSARIGVDGTITTTSGGPSNITTTLQFFTTITNQDIGASSVIPLAYDFTLSKQAGTIGNVNWSLHTQITGDGSAQMLANGTLTTGSNTFTGTGNYTTQGLVTGNGGNDFSVFLYLTYTMTAGDVLFVGMNSASQGVTIAAVPEPSTFALIFGLGALGFVIVRRSRRVRAA
jgi:hypothetical protein